MMIARDSHSVRHCYGSGSWVWCKFLDIFQSKRGLVLKSGCIGTDQNTLFAAKDGGIVEAWYRRGQRQTDITRLGLPYERA